MTKRALTALAAITMLALPLSACGGDDGGGSGGSSDSSISTINSGKLIPRDSPQEIEIRAHTLYATALLCEEVNQRRPKDKQVIIPQIDARLWTHYHTTHWPHHLTRTIMY